MGYRPNIEFGESGYKVGRNPGKPPRICKRLAGEMTKAFQDFAADTGPGTPFGD
jgi:hypothetical protein